MPAYDDLDLWIFREYLTWQEVARGGDVKLRSFKQYLIQRYQACNPGTIPEGRIRQTVNRYCARTACRSAFMRCEG